MAATFSNHSLSLAPRPRTARTPSKTLQPLTLAFPIAQNPSCRYSPAFRTIFSSQIGRRSFTASLKVSGSDSKTVNGEEDNEIWENKAENKSDPQDIPTLKNLIQAYKEAIRDGDEKSVSDIEAAICVMEHEKNKLSLKVAEITADIASGKEKFLRLKADFENFRKRSEKDRLTFTSDIQGELVESLLPMVDSFERAKQQIKPETEKEKKIDTSYQGIYKQFVEIMRSLHVAVVETVGKPFDPLIHEAIAREESQQFKEGIITQEFRRGFALGDRLLRSATVKVSTGPGPRKVSSATEKPTEEPAEAPGPVENSAPATATSNS